jgi:hypothetical protein
MRGLLDGQWYDLESYDEATLWTGNETWSIKDDPERGSFTAGDFEEMSE